MTGTAQGFPSYPWNDSSVFAAVSLEDARPFTVVSYLEKSCAHQESHVWLVCVDTNYLADAYRRVRVRLRGGRRPPGCRSDRVRRQL